LEPLRLLGLNEMNAIIIKELLASSKIHSELQGSQVAMWLNMLGVKMDFTGITYISNEALSALFSSFRNGEQLDIDQLSNLIEWDGADNPNATIINLSTPIQKYLLKWAEDGVLPEQSMNTIEMPTTGLPIVSSETIEYKMPLASKQYTPQKLVGSLRKRLSSYLEASYPLVDPHLLLQRRQLFKKDGGRLLSQEAYIETTPRYKASSKSYKTLSIPTHTQDLLDQVSQTNKEHSPNETILYPGMYTHQAKAIESYLGADKKDLIVATGTGSGKTECFLIPILASLHNEAVSRPVSFKRRGVRVMVLYPLNALVNDQLTRLRQLLGDTQVANLFPDGEDKRSHPVFGMYTGRTPYPGPKDLDSSQYSPDGKRQYYQNKNERVIEPILKYYSSIDQGFKQILQEKGRYPAKDLTSFFATDQIINPNAPRHEQDQNWNERLLTSKEDRELLTRQEMINGSGSQTADAPDVIITNYSMLEYMLIRPFEQALFDQTKAWLESDEENEFLLVLDEAHMYRGSQGAEVAFLIRRLRARLGLSNHSSKFRVICTSASLGTTDKALAEMKKFAADLTGKTPNDFEAITGERDIPQERTVGEQALFDILVKKDLEDLFTNLVQAVDKEKAQEQANTWQNSLKPIFDYFKPNTPCEAETLDDIYAHLYTCLRDHPTVNKLLELTEGSAISITELAKDLFEGIKADQSNLLSLQITATQNLLNLCVIARQNKDSGGLIPTRVHLFFRGLDGLYACINRNCSGCETAESETTAPRTLGKLFAQPRLSCDACGSRVLELSSCRECGNAYVNAYHASEISEDVLASLDFLYAELPGSGQKIELLTTKPYYEKQATRIHVDLKTGYVLKPNEEEASNTESIPRDFWLYTKDDTTYPQFEKCACCQDQSNRAKSKIGDFATKGEIAFTSLIEAQFEEQPPQKFAPHLHNHGKKVLIFSDGRQKAARLAPALETVHNRDLFRQLVVKAIKEAESESRVMTLDKLYNWIMILCIEKNLVLDTEGTSVNSWYQRFNQLKALQQTYDDHNLFRNNEFVQQTFHPTKKIGKYLFDVFTDRYFSLGALGIGGLKAFDNQIDIFVQQYESLFNQLGRDNVSNLVSIWLKLLLERKAYYPAHLGNNLLDKISTWPPQGIDINVDTEIFPLKFNKYLENLFQDQALVTSIKDFLKSLLTANVHTGIFYSPNMDSKRYVHQAQVYYKPFKFESEEGVLQTVDRFLCESCGRIHLENIEFDGQLCCPACAARTITIAGSDYLDARLGHYLNQLDQQELFALATAEHSAQLKAELEGTPMNLVEHYELRFQDIPASRGPNDHNESNKLPIDVLSCTTTMEVGIDIGSLTGVALRNTPPLVANYQQRAGRAGRRGTSIASVVTFAQGSSHDTYYFDDPAKIISGDVQSPVVYIENQQILERHIFSYYLQKFFHEKIQGNNHNLVSAFGTLRDFNESNQAHCFSELQTWISTHEQSLKTEVKAWVPSVSYIREMQADALTETIEHSVQRLITCIQQALNRYDEVLAAHTADPQNEIFSQVLDNFRKKKVLEFFNEKAILPRYAFPLDVINFNVMRVDRNKLKPVYQPDRDLQLALSEFAPSRELTIDKKRFKSEGIFDPFTPDLNVLFEQQTYHIKCGHCGYTMVRDMPPSDTDQCSCCQHTQLSYHTMITPPGFGTSIQNKQPDIGQKIENVGRASRAKLLDPQAPTFWKTSIFNNRIQAIAQHKKELLVVNEGARQNGYVMCVDCGRIEPTPGPGIPFNRAGLFANNGNPQAHKNPLAPTWTCPGGHYKSDFYLGHQFPTDIALLRFEFDSSVFVSTIPNGPGQFDAIKVALTTLSEALCIAAARVLQIDTRELAGYYAMPHSIGHNEAYIFLYDLLPGGAGYTREIEEKENLEKIIEEAIKLLDSNCCESSCHQCLRHYGNQYYHQELNRYLALDLLLNATQQKPLEVRESQVKSATALLSQYFDLKGIDYVQHEDQSDMLKVNDELYCISHPLLEQNHLQIRLQELMIQYDYSVESIDWFSMLFDMSNVINEHFEG
jgi:ATP-dependent helicase YprA (DUF1998 family)